eukprot:7386685-Prymnesium_polylepis.2
MHVCANFIIDASNLKLPRHVELRLAREQTRSPITWSRFSRERRQDGGVRGGGPARPAARPARVSRAVRRGTELSFPSLFVCTVRCTCLCVCAPRCACLLLVRGTCARHTRARRRYSLLGEARDGSGWLGEARDGSGWLGNLGVARDGSGWYVVTCNGLCTFVPVGHRL